MRSRKPIRLDPIKLIDNKKSPRTPSRTQNKNQSKNSKPNNKANNEAKNNLPEKVIKNLKKKSNEKHTKLVKRKSDKVAKKTEKRISRRRPRYSSKKKKVEYQTVNLKTVRKDLIPSANKGSRISSNRALYQRLSPYYSQQNSEPTILPESKHIEQLEKLAKKTNDQPLLNQLIRENIFTRS